MPTGVEDLNWLLGIPNHRVGGIERLEAGEVVLLLDRRKRVPKCPECGQDATGYDTVLRVVRDIPVWGWRTTLAVPWPRAKCSQCGVRSLRYSLVGPTRRRTRRYERWIFELTRWILVAHVADVTGFAWNTVKEIEKRYMVAAMRHFKLDGTPPWVSTRFRIRKGTGT